MGTPIGAVTGALIGLATETGLVRGAGIGAISGAVFSVEAVESSVALWHSSDSGIWSILYVVSQSHKKELQSLKKLKILISTLLTVRCFQSKSLVSVNLSSNTLQNHGYHTLYANKYTFFHV